MFNGFWRYRYLLWNLVSRDFKLKYRRSVLGVLWSVLNPLLMCLVYWAVFSSLMDMRGSGIDNFPVFLMCGQLLFNFFNEATSSSMSSVLSAAPPAGKKVYIPKYIFPLEKCCFAMVNCVFSFVALLLVMIFTRRAFPPDPSGSALPAHHPLLLQPGGGSVPGGGNGVLPGHHAHLERVHHGAALLLRHLL